MTRDGVTGKFMGIGLVKTTCLSCGNVFFLYFSDTRSYCSQRCYWLKSRKSDYINSETLSKKERQDSFYERSKKLCNTCNVNVITRRAKICKTCYGKSRRVENSPYRELEELSYSQRRHRLVTTRGKHSQKEWRELKEKYLYTCLCCKKQEPNVKLTKDHIIPLALGGSNKIDNIQPLCKSCNSKKHTQTINYKNI